MEVGQALGQNREVRQMKVCHPSVLCPLEKYPDLRQEATGGGAQRLKAKRLADLTAGSRVSGGDLRSILSPGATAGPGGVLIGNRRSAPGLRPPDRETIRSLAPAARWRPVQGGWCSERSTGTGASSCWPGPPGERLTPRGRREGPWSGPSGSQRSVWTNCCWRSVGSTAWVIGQQMIEEMFRPPSPDG